MEKDVRRAEEEEEEKEEAMKEAVVDMEQLKLRPTKVWTGLVLSRMCLSSLVKIEFDGSVFFSKVNTESRVCLNTPR